MQKVVLNGAKLKHEINTMKELVAPVSAAL